MATFVLVHGHELMTAHDAMVTRPREVAEVLLASVGAAAA